LVSDSFRCVLLEAYVVPSAGAGRVCALVSLELVDEYSSVQVVVNRACTARRWARRYGGAVCLASVLELAGLVGPGAGASRISALVALIEEQEIRTNSSTNERLRLRGRR
jgi:hypothetical protein